MKDGAAGGGEGIEGICGAGDGSEARGGVIVQVVPPEGWDGGGWDGVPLMVGAEGVNGVACGGEAATGCADAGEDDVPGKYVPSGVPPPAKPPPARFCRRAVFKAMAMACALSLTIWPRSDPEWS